MPFAYLLQCADGTFYAGSTLDLARRVWQHNSADEGALYTRRRRPVVLVWAAEFDSIAEAFAYEKRIQGWSRRKRIALIEGRYDDLPGLSGRGVAAVELRRTSSEVTIRTVVEQARQRRLESSAGPPR